MTEAGSEARSEQRVLGAFLGDDGRLRSIPAKHAKRLVVLDHLAQAFETGRDYSEVEVNAVLDGFHPDHAALRRYLVVEGRLTRVDGAAIYRRASGTEG